MPAAAKGKPIEVWFQDEARVGQKGGHAYIWAKRGSRPAMVRDNRHDPAYLYGALDDPTFMVIHFLAHFNRNGIWRSLRAKG